MVKLRLQSEEQIGARPCAQGLSDQRRRGAVQPFVADLMIEGDRFTRGLEVELLRHSRAAAVELAQRGGAVAGLVVQPHQLPVRALPRRVITQNALPVRDSFRITPTDFTVRHQLLEHGQIGELKPIAFINAPVLIPGLDQIPTVKENSRLKGLRLPVGQAFAGNVAIKIIGLLEGRYIEPPGRFRIDADPARTRDEQPRLRLVGVGSAGQGRAEPPHSLTEIFLGL